MWWTSMHSVIRKKTKQLNVSMGPPSGGPFFDHKSSFIIKFNINFIAL